MANKNHRYRNVIVIDTFIPDEYTDSDLNHDDYKVQKQNEANILAEKIKREIEQLLSEKYNGGIVQINQVYENKFGEI